MTPRIIFLATILLSSPAFADSVTLTIENDAGMVTTREGYTQTECDAAALLLNGSRESMNPGILSTGTVWSNAITIMPQSQSSQPHTSKMTKAQCMRSTQGTKP